MENMPVNLGQLELEVLKVIWDIQPCTVLQVSEVLASRDGYARTTILTIIQRLTKKGVLKRTKLSGVWQYQACQEKKNVLAGLAGQFIDKVFNGSSATLLQHLSPEKLSSAEIEEIEKLLQAARGKGK